jgi:hypothetical protein
MCACPWLSKWVSGELASAVLIGSGVEWVIKGVIKGYTFSNMAVS